MNEHEKRLRDALPILPMRAEIADLLFDLDAARSESVVLRHQLAEMTRDRDAEQQGRGMFLADLRKAQRELAGARAESARLAGERAVLAGLLKRASKALEQAASDNWTQEAQDTVEAIDAALGPAADDLLTGESND